MTRPRLALALCRERGTISGNKGVTAGGIGTTPSAQGRAIMKMTSRTVAMAFAGLMASAAMALAQEADVTGATEAAKPLGATVALAIAAAATMAVSVLGAGYAVGRIGAAALGAAAEKPELLTRSILFVALAEGLAVLGFAIAIMLVQKI